MSFRLHPTVTHDNRLLGKMAAQRLLAELHGESGLELKTLIPPLGVEERLSTDLLVVEDSLVRPAQDIMKSSREGRLGVVNPSFPIRAEK